MQMVDTVGVEPLGEEPGPARSSSRSPAILADGASPDLVSDAETGHGLALTPGGGHDRWLTPRRRLLVGWSVLGVAFALYTAFLGLPYSEDEILLWLTAALIVASLGQPGQWRGVLRDWLPLYIVLAVYALLRGYASDVIWGPFVRPQVAFDSWIGGGQPPTVTLQRWLFRPKDLHPWDYMAWLCYMSHFFTSFIVAGVLWKRDHARFKRYVSLFVSLTFLGYLTYLLYPAMPPWLASNTGHIARITRIIPVMWDHVGIHGAGALFTGNNRFDNNIAAMPSLHAAYPMLLLLFFWKRARTPLRVILVTYVLCMAFTLVYTGEHFVIDVFVGWTYAIITYFVGSRLLDRWAAWRKATKQRRKLQDGSIDEPTPDSDDSRPVTVVPAFEGIQSDS
jgi:membrane-associated phospholipid phosphatase